MTDEEFGQLTALPHELRGVEFKGPGPCRHGRLMAQIVKAVLGMANRRDGGLVVIGVEESVSGFDWIGVSESDLATWKYDAVADQIARYADPSVTFDLEIREYNGDRFIVLQVEEFDDIPVLCKRSYDDVLRDGACYVRTRRKPETTEIPTQAEMRDLLDLATEKGVQRFLDQVQRAGLMVTPAIISHPVDEQLFDERLGDLR